MVEIGILKKTFRATNDSFFYELTLEGRRLIDSFSESIGVCAEEIYQKENEISDDG